MCIAILNTKKAGRLPKSHIKNSWENNDMGAGLLWNENNKLNVFKTYDYDEYIDKYNELRDTANIGNIVLHFRIATSGYKGEHNLHPFLVNDNLGFVHNGVIRGLGNKQFSDTYEFNDMLKKFSHDFINCDMTKYFLSEYIGNSKLVFLSADDKYTIINEELGKWSDGNWYSNDSYKQYNDYKFYGNTKVYNKTTTTTDVKFDDFDDWDYAKGWDYTPAVKKTEEEEWELDEWDMYEEICDIYGLDPNEDATFKQIETYMEINEVDTIYDLYCLLINYKLS
jgi:predicted glutamine amidotransferase